MVKENSRCTWHREQERRERQVNYTTVPILETTTKKEANTDKGILTHKVTPIREPSTVLASPSALPLPYRWHCILRQYSAIPCLRTKRCLHDVQIVTRLTKV
jgi:hypothetical protein